MNEKKRANIERLAVIYAEKKSVFEAHQVANMPLPYDDRVEAMKKWAIAKAELLEAEAQLEKAMQP